MALSSASPQIANVKDGDKSPPGDLEEGEIEDGELPDEDGDAEAANPSKTRAEHPMVSPIIGHRSSVKGDKPAEKPNESVGRMSRRKAALLHNADRNNDQEEEWACVVEKKLKAAIGKDIGNEKVNGNPSINVAEKPQSSTEDDKKNRRKKRKKKHKEDEDDDRKDAKKRKRSHHWEGEDAPESGAKEKNREGEDGEEDDDEMLFVRGASPVMRENLGGKEKSPTSRHQEKGFSFNQQGAFEEAYDSYNEEESDFDGREDFGRGNHPLSDDETPKRGLGRGAKRRQRTVGRILPPKRQARKDTKSKRGGLKRQQPSRSNSDREPNVCMFFMQGKCQKGEDCPYSHNACPPRKMELCKFYLMDCCAKKDKCLYMHHDFPCKFFHTGLKCFSGPRCKFSHGHLTDAMRSILLKGTEGNRHNELRLSNRPSVPSQEHRSKHLETAPKDLLGDFPRLSREGAAAMVFNKKNRSSKGKKIPSLFDIEVPIPAQLLAEQKESSKDQSPRRTPMPESDNEDQDGTTTPMPQSPGSDGKAKGKSQRWGSDDVHGSHSRDSKEDENLVGGDDEEKKSLIPKFYQETDSETGNKTNSDKERGKLNLHRFAGYSPNQVDEKTASSEPGPVDKSLTEEKDQKRKSDDKKTFNDSGNADSGTESNDAANIPLHLPKKQRELFLRIQQQQREAESSQEQGGDQDEDTDVVPEENWYSSDDEEDSLTNVLKNLSKQDQQPVNQPEAASTSSTDLKIESNLPSLRQSSILPLSTSALTLPTSSTPIMLSTLPDLSKIKIDESFTKLLSSIRSKSASVATTTSISTPATVTTPGSISAPTTATVTTILNASTSAPTSTSTLAAAAITSTSSISTDGVSSEQLVAQPPTASAARDPRLSRDPRSRSQSSASTTSNAAGVFTSALDNATTTPAPTSAALSTTVDPPRRTDPRRSHDPRSSKSSHKSEAQDHKHSGSVSSRRSSGGSHSSSSSFPSIYSNAIMGEKISAQSGGLGLGIGSTNASDVDLRNFMPRTLDTGDVDLRSRSDTDLRTGQPPSSLAFGDTDLRVRSHDLVNVDGSRSNSDVDLRMLELPFKPVPMHTPATEIEASLTSHPPIPYKVVVVTIPRPDYTSLKLNTSDPHVQSDPRLRKIFKLQSPGPETPSRSSLGSSGIGVSRNDPRRQSSRSSSSSSTSTSAHSSSHSSGHSTTTTTTTTTSSSSSGSGSSTSHTSSHTGAHLGSHLNSQSGAHPSLHSGAHATTLAGTHSGGHSSSHLTAQVGGHGNSGTGSSSSAPANTEHLEKLPEPFAGPQLSNVISGSTSEMANVNSLLRPYAGMHPPIANPASSPLLPNPPSRIGRDPRSAPGLLGPAPLPANYCPNTPMFEEQADLSSGMDNDPHVMFSRGSANGAKWDQQSSSSSHASRGNWRNNRRNPQSRYVEQEYNSRSYTPPT